MNYIFDIVLNFQKEYYNFFEWNRTDRIKNIYKVSIYNVTEQDLIDLKEFLKDRLTNYMIPTVFMQLDEMPQTANGKTDLRNLPEPVLITEYVAPENDVEAFFANCFQDVLGIDKVGVTDNFFEIAKCFRCIFANSVLPYKPEL